MRIVERPVAGAATHAFVVGVGEYPNLPPELGPRDLSSAAASAVAFADWLEKAYQNPAAPLATLELVLTPGAFPYAGPPVERATIDHIRARFKAFFDAANQSAHNVAIFYFAGHGVAESASFLLAEDFDPAHNQADPWFGAFSMDKTYLGLGRCQAAVQLIFVEACRTRSPDDFDTPGIDVPGLASPTKNPVQRDAPLVFACEAGQPAYGEPGRPASFTQALLHVLAGAAAEKRAGAWELGTDHLARVGDVLAVWSKHELVPTQYPEVTRSGRSTPLLRFAEPPRVEAIVRPSPAVASPGARLHVEGPGAPAGELPLGPPARRWRVPLVKGGTYTFSATGPAGEQAGPTTEHVAAPCQVVEL